MGDTIYVQKGAVNHIADPRLKGNFDEEQLNSAVLIALRCTDSSPENMPSVMQMVELLKGVVGRSKKEVYYEDHEMAREEDDEKNNKINTAYQDSGVEPISDDHVGTTWPSRKLNEMIDHILILFLKWRF